MENVYVKKNTMKKKVKEEEGMEDEKEEAGENEEEGAWCSIARFKKKRGGRGSDKELCE